MHRIFLFFFPVIIFSSQVKSQETDKFFNNQKPANLVPNPGFEDVSSDPCSWCQDATKYWKAVDHWFSPTETTPDLFSSAVKPDCWSNPKKHSDGKQYPHFGARMAGIKTYGKGGTDTFWHEYLMVKLDSALEKGVKYYAEVWVTRAQKSERASNNIGLYFSDTLLETRNRMPLFYTPQVNEPEIIKPKFLSPWKKISGVFEAESEAQYLIIGNFYDDRYTKTEKFPEGEGGAYYYVDDVVVRRALPGEKLTPRPEESIAPAPKIVIKDEEVVSTETVKLDSIEFKKGNTIRLEKIFFEFDKATLLPESREELKKIHDVLYDYPHLKIEIRGHTDNIGKDEYNQNLSEARARAVVDYVVKLGTDKDRISFKGFGSSSPVASNDTEEGRKLNRRVEFHILED